MASETIQTQIEKSSIRRMPRFLIGIGGFLIGFTASVPFLLWKLVPLKFAVQPSVHPTWGTRRVFEHVSGFSGVPFRRRLHPPTPSG